MKLLFSAPGEFEWILILLALIPYFIPSIIGRKTKSAFKIFLVNLFFEWTLIGWGIALFYAINTVNSEKADARHNELISALTNGKKL